MFARLRGVIFCGSFNEEQSIRNPFSRSHAPAWECILNSPLCTNLQQTNLPHIVSRTGIAPMNGFIHIPPLNRIIMNLFSVASSHHFESIQGEYLPAKTGKPDLFYEPFCKKPVVPKSVLHCCHSGKQSAALLCRISTVQYHDQETYFARPDGNDFPISHKHRPLDLSSLNGVKRLKVSFIVTVAGRVKIGIQCNTVMAIK